MHDTFCIMHTVKTWHIMHWAQLSALHPFPPAKKTIYMAQQKWTVISCRNINMLHHHYAHLKGQ